MSWVTAALLRSPGDSRPTPRRPHSATSTYALPTRDLPGTPPPGHDSYRISRRMASHPRKPGGRDLAEVALSGPPMTHPDTIRPLRLDEVRRLRQDLPKSRELFRRSLLQDEPLFVPVDIVGKQGILVHAKAPGADPTIVTSRSNSPFTLFVACCNSPSSRIRRTAYLRNSMP